MVCVGFTPNGSMKASGEQRGNTRGIISEQRGLFFLYVFDRFGHYFNFGFSLICIGNLSFPIKSY